MAKTWRRLPAKTRLRRVDEQDLCLVHLLGKTAAINSLARCLCVYKTESHGLSRICFEMTHQAKMPSLEGVTFVLFICLSSARQLKCLRVSKTESYVICRIHVLKWRARPKCLHRQLKCLRVSKTESYGLSRICFEITRQATMPSSKAWLCLADEQHISLADVACSSAQKTACLQLEGTVSSRNQNKELRSQ
jgi:hypothetical protein